ncbi:MAG: NAD(P)/FAD-dependent oxidoreductase [Comamonas sp.]
MSPAEQALAGQVRRALQLLRDAPADWVPPRAGTDHDVFIVGGGQSGMAIGLALRRAGIGRITTIDQAPEGSEGVWSTIARMPTLRTAKSLTGPESGIAELGFEAWYEATRGAAAYAALERIPRLAWAEYLRWYRQASASVVRNGTRLLDIEPLAGRGLQLTLRAPDGRTVTEVTRKLVLSTGVNGCGTPRIPDQVRQALAPALYSHTHAPLPDLAGKRVAVLGAGASAFDAASTALEQGAAQVHLFARRPDLARGSRMKAFSHVGAFEFFHTLPDADRWQLMRAYRESGGAPPRHAVQRAAGHQNFHLHLGSRWQGLRQEENEILLDASDGSFAFDHLVLGTGYAVDLASRPELARIAPQIATWSQHHRPEWGAPDAELGRHPYLDAGFGFTEARPGTAPWLANIHCFGAPAMASHGRPVGDTGSLKHNVPRLVSSIGRDLFLADRAWQVEYLQRMEADELDGSEYAGRVWSPGSETAPTVEDGA